MMIPRLASKPSISTRSWLSVCSLSSLPPPSPAPLLLPTASISSMNTIQGAFFFASAKRSLTLDAPTPTNISTKSEPDIEKNGTPASPAVAFEMYVFPVPGLPTRRTPLGILAPSLVYLDGFFRKSTISASSSFSSSRPATSLNDSFLPSPLYSLALFFPNWNACLLPPWLTMKYKSIIIAPTISIVGSMFRILKSLSGGLLSIVSFFSSY